MSNKSSADLLNAGLQQMQIDLAPLATQKLLDYVTLLAKWSKAYNLTTVRDPQDMITQHILDSLSVLPFLIAAGSVLDIGTGAGLPGIPLAIARPDLSFILLDSQRKKINFVQHVITSLQLGNVSVLNCRVEELPANLKGDMIVSRAFSSLDNFVKLIAKVCDSETKIVAMKGRRELVESEALQLPEEFTLMRIESLSVPQLNAERCLAFIKKQGD